MAIVAVMFFLYFTYTSVMTLRMAMSVSQTFHHLVQTEISQQQRHEILHRPSWSPHNVSWRLCSTPDVSPSAPMRLTFVIWNEMCQQLFDGSPWSLNDIFVLLYILYSISVLYQSLQWCIYIVCVCECECVCKWFPYFFYLLIMCAILSLLMPYAFYNSVCKHHSWRIQIM